MKEFSFEEINKEINRMLEEMQIHLQEFDELKDCYIDKNCIKVGTYLNVCSIGVVDYAFIFQNNYITLKDTLRITDVFEEIGNNLTSIKIKAPLPHQARKKTLEELEIGDSYYEFDNSEFYIMHKHITDLESYHLVKIVSESELVDFKNKLKHTRILIALDEDEIKNKVLD